MAVSLFESIFPIRLIGGLWLPDSSLGNLHHRPGPGLTTGNKHEAVIDSVLKSDPPPIDPEIVRGR